MTTTKCFLQKITVGCFAVDSLWLAWSKVRFLMLPRERRVRLEVTTDGRHLTFLLTALGEAGYGVHVVGAPFIFRELMCLRKSVPMPFVVGGKERECGIWITDRRAGNSLMAESGERMADGGKKTKQGVEFAERSSLDCRRSTLFVLDYDCFSGLTTKHTNIHEREEAGLRLAGQVDDSEPSSLTSKLAHAPASEPLIRSADGPASSLDTVHSPPATALRAPYFMHPSVYHKGLHRSREQGVWSLEPEALDPRPSTPDSAAKQRRRFRIGFFGTHDREFYTKHYHFPGMNRFEILKVFFQKFGDRITHLQGFPRDWDPYEIAVSMDSRGGDRKGKSFLSQETYFEALRECDFVLSPPGWCMPVSHNLIEAMFCGAIPITNGGAFMARPLNDGETCLEFEDAMGLSRALDKALSMDAGEKGKMRAAVLDYYGRFLDPKAFGEALERSESGRVLVNSEENSVRLVFPGIIFPWDVPAEA